MSAVPLTGSRVRRVEDPPLVRGEARFVDDLQRPGLLHLGFVHSSEAHARLVDVDVSGALDVPGVVAAYAAADLPEAVRTGMMTPTPPGVARTVLASDRVRYVGEPVAVVVAEDLYAVADGAEQVIVDYDPLPAVTSAEEAMGEGAPVLFDELGTNVVMEAPSAEDLTDLFSSAPHVLRLRFENQRLAPQPMEPSGVLAEWDGAHLIFRSASQCPHAVRTLLGRLFDIPQSSIRVVVPNVGGAFGAKNAWYPEFTLTAWLARELGRPVKYTQFRTAATLNLCHGRDQVQWCDVAFDDEGRILGLGVDIVQNGGAYPTVDSVVLAKLTKLMSSGAYGIPRISVKTRCVATNTTPVRPYRGAGRPEATYFVERIVDHIADELALDPIDVRRKNFIATGSFPYETPTEAGALYDSGDYPGMLERLLELVDYETLQAEQARRRAGADEPLLGIGFATFVEFGGVGPSSFFKNDVSREVGGWEACTVRLFPDGSVTALVGTSPHGQGHETVFAQLVADELGVPFEGITIVHSDTAAVPHGVGTVGSRSMAVGGSAVVQSARKVVDKARIVAAHLLEANPDDLEFAEGRFSVRGTPVRGMTILEASEAAWSALDLPSSCEAGLDATTFWEPDNFVYSAGAYAAVVAVDRETGEVSIERFVAVDDIGRVLNPLLAEGQVHGGVTQGLAQALYEGMVYDETGQPLTSNFLDYLVPSAAEVPRFESEFFDMVSPVNPLGAKGVGESGAVGAPAALVNAVVDALSHLGVRDLAMPMSPFRVWSAMQAAAGSDGGEG